jgi:chromosome condensin MukBEF complex kleisin-like MukF subunit
MATQAALDAAAKLDDLPAKEAALRAVAFAEGAAADAETIKVKEAAVALLSDALTQQKKAAELAQLLEDLRGFFAVIPKAKTAKIVRTVIDQIAKVPDSTELQVRLGLTRVSFFGCREGAGLPTPQRAHAAFACMCASLGARASKVERARARARAR